MFLENCGETGMDSPRQNHQGLTVLEMQAWSYKLETQDLKMAQGSRCAFFLSRHLTFMSLSVLVRRQLRTF